VERLLTTIAEMDYPKHLLEIQVLDDSTDDSVVETEALIHKITGRDLILNTLDVAIELVIKREH
jgi:hypothetical protein